MLIYKFVSLLTLLKFCSVTHRRPVMCEVIVVTLHVEDNVICPAQKTACFHVNNEIKQWSDQFSKMRSKLND